MGIVPIWGFQLAVAIPIAIFCRLNKALVIIAANISIPPMIPGILFLSHLTGALWLGREAVYLPFSNGLNLEALNKSLYQYIIGACTLAVIAGLLTGFVAYWILQTSKKSKEI
ncbi:MAG: DUF2062 domain-containing protein [Saprospiraceae bacterium]